MGFLDRFRFNQPEPTVIKYEPNYVGSFNFSNVRASILSDKNMDLSKPWIEDRYNFPYIPFGQDNLYPYQLLNIYNSSPFHSSIIEFKANLIFKNDLIYHIKTDTLEDRLKLEKLKLLLTRDFLNEFVLQYLIHQRIHLEIKSQNGVIKSVNVIPAEKVRFTSNAVKWSGVYVNEDWTRRNMERPLKNYDKFYKGTEPQVLSFQRITPGFYHYAVPVYTKASNWIYLDGEMSYFQKQNINNSMNPSMMITIYEQFESPEQKKKFIEQLRDSLEGARNAGKALIMTARNKDVSPDIKMVESNKLDKSFMNTQEAIIKNVSYSHMINPSVMGISTAGQLGATQQLQDAFNIFKTAYLTPTQEVLEEYLNKLLPLYDLSGKIEVDKNITLF
jgi:hypothetical protein